MNRFDICIAAGPVVGFGTCLLAISNHTDLPIWAGLLISVPLGVLVGFFGGLVVGVIVEFLMYGQTEETRTPRSMPHRH